MNAIERIIELAMPRQDVEGEWQRVQAKRRARVRFTQIDERNTRAHISGEAGDVEAVMGDLRAFGLAGREAAGNPGARGAAPGAAGGTFPGGTGGTPGPGGGKPGTTP
jgi:hypothetical protein